VSGDANIQSRSFGVSFVVIAATYGVSLSQTAAYSFPDAIFGYPAQKAKTVDITNTGNRPTGNLTVSAGTDFEVTTPENGAVTSIPVGETAAFSVRPNTGLAVGTHIATVTVSGIGGTGAANIQSRSFGVSFEVTAIASYLTLPNSSTPISLGVADLSALCSNSAADATITVGGQTVVKNTITKVALGSAFAGVTALPDNFCRSFGNLTELDLSGLTGLTSVGNSFLVHCVSFNQPLVIPSGVTVIGSDFLTNCQSFNEPLTLPSDLTVLGDCFLYGCTAFNQPLTLPSGLTSLPNKFLAYSPSFNKPLVVPEGVTRIGYDFLLACTAFNNQLTLPSTLTSIDTYFLEKCASFNQPLTLPAVTVIGNRFMWDCSSFNRTLTIPATVTAIGTHFLFNCNNMTSTVTVHCPATAFATSNESFATSTATADSYVTGIPIAGPNKAAMITRFPNRTTSPFRKLIAAP
jgi:hypothetical protein